MSCSAERYTGNNVCDKQDDFNVAVRNAVVASNREAMRENRSFLKYYMLFLAIAFFWAIILAMKVDLPVDRKVYHMLFAILFSPAYVIASLMARK